MKMLLVVGIMLTLSACAAGAVSCAGPLTPINVPAAKINSHPGGAR
jgi:hypothetical protein